MKGDGGQGPEIPQENASAHPAVALDKTSNTVELEIGFGKSNPPAEVWHQCCSIRSSPKVDKFAVNTKS
jgi:hypothetical protein